VSIGSYSRTENCSRHANVNYDPSKYVKSREILCSSIIEQETSIFAASPKTRSRGASRHVPRRRCMLPNAASQQQSERHAAILPRQANLSISIENSARSVPATGMNRHRRPLRSTSCSSDAKGAILEHPSAISIPSPSLFPSFRFFADCDRKTGDCAVKTRVSRNECTRSLREKTRGLRM